LKVKGASGNI